MMDRNTQPSIPWPVRILIHVYQLRASGYIRLTDRGVAFVEAGVSQAAEPSAAESAGEVRA